MASIAMLLDEPPIRYLSERERADQATTSAESVQETLSGRQLLSSTVIGSGRSVGRLTLVGPLGRGSVPWALPTARALSALTELPAGWNSYSAPPVDRQTAVAAFELLARIMLRDTPGPAIVPTVRGGVQFEWHTPEFDLEIAVLSPFRAEVFYEDPGGHTWEVAFPHAFLQLEQVIARMTA